MDTHTSTYLESTFGLVGRTALVTGATAGIGRAIAEAFTRAGAHVCVHGLRLADAAAVGAELDADFYACDLSDPEAIAQMCRDLRQRTGRLDVLVNNAGVEEPAAIDDLTEDTVQRTFAVNFTAPAMLVRHLLPVLLESPDACIINISSIHDRVPYPENLAYAASKSALRMLTETLAVELGPRGIRVNALSPGAIATDINADVIEHVGADAFARMIPLGRVGTRDEVADPAVFLASRAARYVTGATLVADGAYSHHLIRYRVDGA